MASSFIVNNDVQKPNKGTRTHNCINNAVTFTKTFLTYKTKHKIYIAFLLIEFLITVPTSSPFITGFSLSINLIVTEVASDTPTNFDSTE